jgi:hypothetical protein
MAVVELDMQMPEMADAEAGDLEDEDRVNVLDHVLAGIFTVEAADVGRDIAYEDVADLFGDFRRAPVLVPAVQHIGDPRIGEQRVMRGIGAVHGDDVGQPSMR